MKQYRLLLCLLAAALFYGCQSRSSMSADGPALDTIALKYAHGFQLAVCDDYTRLDIYTPWGDKHDIEQRYYLVERAKGNVATPDDGVRISVPIEKWATASCTHIGFLNAIGQQSKICGVTNPNLIYTHDVRQAIEQEKIVDIGDALNINTERLLALHPGMLIVNLIGSNDTQAQHLLSTGIPLLYNNEWKETHPLGRAEWIKVFGALTDEVALADSIFNTIEDRYLALKQRAIDSPWHPCIFSGGNFRGTWYVPTGNTYMGCLFADAQACYKFADDMSPESIPLDMEQALLNFADADIWLGAPANSYAELLKQDEKYALLNAVKQKHVYNFYHLSLKGGANDFWETGVMRPDMILSDIITMLYGKQVSGADSLYFASELE